MVIWGPPGMEVEVAYRTFGLIRRSDNNQGRTGFEGAGLR